jgi:hypothetical protein
MRVVNNVQPSTGLKITAWGRPTAPDLGSVEFRKPAAATNHAPSHICDHHSCHSCATVDQSCKQDTCRRSLKQKDRCLQRRLLLAGPLPQGAARSCRQPPAPSLLPHARCAAAAD